MKKGASRSRIVSLLLIALIPLISLGQEKIEYCGVVNYIQKNKKLWGILSVNLKKDKTIVLTLAKGFQCGYAQTIRDSNHKNVNTIPLNFGQTCTISDGIYLTMEYEYIKIINKQIIFKTTSSFDMKSLKGEIKSHPQTIAIYPYKYKKDFIENKIFSWLFGSIGFLAIVAFFIREYIKNILELHFQEKKRVLYQECILANNLLGALSSSKIIIFIKKSPNILYPQFEKSYIDDFKLLLNKWEKGNDYFQNNRLNRKKDKLLLSLENYLYYLINEIGINEIGSNKEQLQLKLEESQLEKNKDGVIILKIFATKVVNEYNIFATQIKKKLNI